MKLILRQCVLVQSSFWGFLRIKVTVNSSVFDGVDLIVSSHFVGIFNPTSFNIWSCHFIRSEYFLLTGAGLETAVIRLLSFGTSRGLASMSVTDFFNRPIRARTICEIFFVCIISLIFDFNRPYHLTTVARICSVGDYSISWYWRKYTASLSKQIIELALVFRPKPFKFFASWGDCSNISHITKYKKPPFLITFLLLYRRGNWIPDPRVMNIAVYFLSDW